MKVLDIGFLLAVSSIMLDFLVWLFYEKLFCALRTAAFFSPKKWVKKILPFKTPYAQYPEDKVVSRIRSLLSLLVVLGVFVAFAGWIILHLI